MNHPEWILVPWAVFAVALALMEDDDEETGEDLGELLLEVLPGDGSTIGNLSAREALSRVSNTHRNMD